MTHLIEEPFCDYTPIKISERKIRWLAAAFRCPIAVANTPLPKPFYR